MGFRDQNQETEAIPTTCAKLAIWQVWYKKPASNHIFSHSNSFTTRAANGRNYKPVGDRYNVEAAKSNKTPPTTFLSR
jgi:hypothetical protein